MLKVRYTQKFRNKNNIIVGYRIIDQNGDTKDVSSESLKQAIKQGRLEVINLILTSNNRLIDKKINQTPNQRTQKPIKQSPQKTIGIDDNMLLRLKLLGCITEIDEGCDHTIHLAKISKEDYRLIIPDDVTKIKFDYNYNEPTPINTIPIESSNARLTVYGGNNLKIAEGLFQGTVFKTIDLKEFNTSKVTDMSGMFMECQATSIDLSSFNTRKVKNMSWMFHDCQATSLDLSNFDTSKVTNMSAMFNGCKATSLDLSSFDTSKVTNMDLMFCECEATSLDLSNFDTRSIMNVYYMFYECKATHINFGENKTLKSARNSRIIGGN